MPFHYCFNFDTFFFIKFLYARMAELVRRNVTIGLRKVKGSIPFSGTKEQYLATYQRDTSGRLS